MELVFDKYAVGNVPDQPKGLHMKTPVKLEKKKVPGVISVDEAVLKHHLPGIMWISVEETRNAVLDVA